MGVAFRIVLGAITTGYVVRKTVGGALRRSGLALSRDPVIATGGQCCGIPHRALREQAELLGLAVTVAAARGPNGLTLALTARPRIAAAVRRGAVPGRLIDGFILRLGSPLAGDKQQSR